MAEQIPVQNPDGLDVLGIFLHVLPRRIKRGTRLGANRLTFDEKYGIMKPLTNSILKGGICYEKAICFFAVRYYVFSAPFVMQGFRARAYDERLEI